MEEILKAIKNDEEIQNLRKQWIELNEQGVISKPCLGFNFDEYSDIEEYRDALKSGIKEVFNK